MGRARRAGRSVRSFQRWVGGLAPRRVKWSNCCCLGIGLVLGACLLLTVAGIASAQTPAPTATTMTATPAPVVQAQPVVVVGYGQGSRGVEQGILAAVLIFGTMIVTLLFYTFIAGGGRR